MKPVLSIIILNYNTAKVTVEAIESIEKSHPRQTENGEYQIIVADNASPDDSLQRFEEFKKKSKIKNFDIVDNKKNIGFAAGNNNAYKKAEGEYLLFLNPDTLVNDPILPDLLKFLKDHSDAGIVTCKLLTLSGKADEASHRGFPTPWNAFCHFSGLEKIFPKSRFFAGYTQGWKNFNSIHEVDACSGAFMLMRRKVFEEVGRWDEDYFFYGEDLDLCFEAKKHGYKIYFVPSSTVVHLGGVSSGIKKRSQQITTSNLEIKTKVQRWRFDAMRIFYKKHYTERYPKFLTWLVFKGIDFMQKRNIIKLQKSVNHF